MNPTRFELRDREEVKRFRRGVVLKPGSFDLSKLKEVCERIVYATDGYGVRTDEIKQQLEEGLKEFDPHTDVLVPLGSASICVMAAVVLTRSILQSKRDDIDGFMMGVFLPPSGSYEFWHVPIHPEDRARELQSEL